MSATAANWSMFALGVLSLLGVVWIYKGRRTARRAGRGLSARSLGGFAIFVGCMMVLQDLMEFQEAVRWQVMALSFLVGGVCGMFAGKTWILRHPQGETTVQSQGLARLLRRWGFVILLVLVALMVATIPAFSPILRLISSRSNLQAVVGEGLAGLFLVFGLMLTATHQR